MLEVLRQKVPSPGADQRGDDCLLDAGFPLYGEHTLPPDRQQHGASPRGQSSRRCSSGSTSSSTQGAASRWRTSTEKTGRSTRTRGKSADLGFERGELQAALSAAGFVGLGASTAVVTRKESRDYAVFLITGQKPLLSLPVVWPRRQQPGAKRTSMSKHAIVTFPGGKRVDAEYGGFTIRTDEPPKGGGEGSRATALRPVPGLDRDLRRDLRQGLLRCARDLQRGPRHRDAHRARPLSSTASGSSSWRSSCRRVSPEAPRGGHSQPADLCSVKKHIFNPPAFEIRTV